MVGTLSCLICAACNAPLCQSSDVYHSPVVAGINPAHTFAYELEDLLDLTAGVWCYNCSEDVETRVSLTGPDLSPTPWTTAPRGSHHDDISDGHAMPSRAPPAPTLVGNEEDGTTHVPLHWDRESSSSVAPMRSVEVTSKRFDILRVDAARTVGTTMLLGPRLLGDVSFEESGAIVDQRRSSSSEQWFQAFEHSSKLHCLQCQAHVGWFFTPVAGAASMVVENVLPNEGPNITANGSNGSDDDDHAENRCGSGGEGRASSVVVAPFCGLMMRTLKQRDWSLSELLQPAALAVQRRNTTSQQRPAVGVEGTLLLSGATSPPSAPLGASAIGSNTAATSGPHPAGGAVATTIDAAALLPANVEEIMLRVHSLRTQTNLYVDLLTKHKEQGDVQRQLLVSQKDRIAAHEEKLATMQQIVEAQRQQLEMQHRHMRYQEELLRNQREQIHTQQQQIEVEQLLLGEQNKTIHSQLEQMKIMQVHLRAKDERIRLETEVRRLQELRCKASGASDAAPQLTPAVARGVEDAEEQEDAVDRNAIATTAATVVGE